MPALSPTMTEGTINNWLVKIGDKVKAGDIIAEIETDKATMEVEAVDEGVITHLLDANPDKSVQNVKKKLSAAIADVRSGGDLKKLNRLKQQISKLNSIGGFKAVVPAEGIVFKYKGKTYKFTGAFAPINQITGLMTF